MATPPQTLTFPSIADLLTFVASRAGHIGYLTVTPKGKKVVPVACEPGAFEALVNDHLAGVLRARSSAARDGDDRSVTGVAVAVYPVMPVDDRCVTSILVFDIDGPGHADGLPASDVERITVALSDLLERSNLSPITVKSMSGAGRHVWVVFAEPVPAGMARWIGETVRDLVPGAKGVEIFPKQTGLRPMQIGSAITLPASGSPTGVGGGVRIDRSGSDLSWSNLRCAEPAIIAALTTRWATYAASLAEASTIARQSARFHSLSNNTPALTDDYTDIGLEAVARAVATIADDRVTESHIIGVLCPTHGGSCFHIEPEQGWFICHKCGHRGAGPAAALMLLRLFQPYASASDHRAFLETLRSRVTTGAPEVAS